MRWILTLLLLLPAAEVSAQQIRSVRIPVRSMVYDSVSKKLYASVGSGGPGATANTVTTIDPVTGQIERSVFIGSDPGPIIVSDGGKYLYISLGNSFRRYDLSTHMAGPQYPVGPGLTIGGMAAVPGDPDAVLVMRANPSTGQTDSGTALYRNGTPLPMAPCVGRNLTPAFVPGRYYTYENTISSYQVSAIELAADGIHTSWTQAGLITGNSGLQGGNGLLFTSGGSALDPEARQGLGQIPGISPDLGFYYDVPHGLVFQAQPGKLIAGSVATWTKAGEMPMPGVPGGTGLTRWGEDGFAFFTEKEVYLVRTPLPPRLPDIDLSVSRSAFPAVLRPGVQVNYRLTVRNNSAAACTGARLTDLVPPGSEISNLKASQGSTGVTGNVVRADLGTIGPSAQVTVDVSLRLGDGEPMAFTAIVRCLQPDPRPENNASALNAVPAVISAPDLTGAWESLRQDSAGAGANLRAVINGSIVVRNAGTRPSPPSRVRFFLSGPAFDPARAALLQEVAIPGLRAGGAARVELTAPLDRGEDAIGLYVAVVIDPTNDVAEANEKNNTVAARKIP